MKFGGEHKIVCAEASIVSFFALSPANLLPRWVSSGWHQRHSLLQLQATPMQNMRSQNDHPSTTATSAQDQLSLGSSSSVACCTSMVAVLLSLMHCHVMRLMPKHAK